MDRSYCQMYSVLNGEIFCDYYDVGCFKCTDIEIGDCPDGLDDEDDFYYEDEMDI